MFKLYKYNFQLYLSAITITFCLFFLYIVTIPLLIGFSTQLLYYYHCNIIWMSIVFSFLPERFFQQDFDDGSIELYFVSSCSIRAILTTKLVSFWCLKICGILCSFPFISLLYQFQQSLFIYYAMILGSLVFTLMCGIHSTLTITVKSNIWNSIQHFTTLPTLLPLILLCTRIDAQPIYLCALTGLLLLFLWIFWVFVLIVLQKLLSR